MKRLSINRETVRSLNENQLEQANGMSGQTCHNTICCCNTTAPTGSWVVCCEPTEYATCINC